MIIHSSAWDEIHDVFGDGHEYDWALVGDEEADYEEEHMKPEMKYQDVSIVILHHCSIVLTPLDRSLSLQK